MAGAVIVAPPALITKSAQADNRWADTMTYEIDPLNDYNE